MNIHELKNNLDLLPHIKSLIDGDELIVSFRDMYVTKNFKCSNDHYVTVIFDSDSVLDVVTSDFVSCDFWRSVDDINKMIQGIVS